MDRIKNRKIIRYIGFATLAITLLLFVSVFVCTVANAGELDIMLPEGSKAEDFLPESDVVKIRQDPVNEQRMIITANGRGKVFIVNEAADDGDINQRSFEYVKVLPGGIIYNMSDGNFSGYRQITSIV